MKKGLLVVLALFVMVGLAQAQGVAGKWTGEQQGRGGAMPLTLELKADGSGTMTVGQGSPMALKDGKVDGMKVSFTVTQAFGGNNVDVMYTGEVKGDELTLMRMGGGGGRGG